MAAKGTSEASAVWTGLDLAVENGHDGVVRPLLDTGLGARGSVFFTVEEEWARGRVWG